MLIFWLYNHAGHLVSVDTLHGFAHRGDCVVFAKHIPPFDGRVEWKCVKDNTGGQHDYPANPSR